MPDISFPLVNDYVIFFTLFIVAIPPVLYPLRIPVKLRQLAQPFDVTIDFASSPLIAVLISLITTSLPIGKALAALWPLPFSILVLFFSLAVICISIDSTGLFELIATSVISRAGRDPKRIWTSVFLLSAGMTVFTSNDIVILTLTPIVCYLCKNAGWDAMPFLYAQFFAANIFSFLLYIGNPTNIIVAETFHLNFFQYSFWMFAPCVLSGLTSYAVLYWYFRDRLPELDEASAPRVDEAKLSAPAPVVFVKVTCLVFCLASLCVASFYRVPLWAITLPFALIVLVVDVVSDLRARKVGKNQGEEHEFRILRSVSTEQLAPTDVVLLPQQTAAAHQQPQKRSSLRFLYDHLPWKIIPFVLGMFVLVDAVRGWAELAGASFLVPLVRNVNQDFFGSVFLIGFLSILFCQLINNQPMTILFTSLIESKAVASSLSIASQRAMMFSLIMGSNFGANFTLIGALAGVMWRQTLVTHGLQVSYVGFLRVGCTVMPPVVLVGLSTLAVQCYIL